MCWHVHVWNVSVYAGTCVCMLVRAHEIVMAGELTCLPLCMWAILSVCTYLCVSECVCVRVYMCASFVLTLFMHVCVCACIYIYMYIYCVLLYLE